jgi:[ribosomal protein S5]-alanine N-acetyltransferase
MERMPYQAELEGTTQVISSSIRETVTSDWQRALPMLRGARVMLRELHTSDAPALFAMLSTEEVARFISPPPVNVEGFERFIAWANRHRDAGTYACFAVTLRGFETAIGIFQLRQCGADFRTAEWGFAIGSPFWGTGVFQEGASLLLDFAFDTVGVHRLEARAAVTNGRGNGALRKVGAVREAILRKSFLRNGEWVDQALYAILEDDWRATIPPPITVELPKYVH